MAETRTEFLEYKGKPLVRCGDVIYYGDMKDKYVVKLHIRSKQKSGDIEIADKVFIQLLSTDTSNPKKAVIKAGEQPNLFLALDLGYVWLKRALKGGQ